MSTNQEEATIYAVYVYHYENGWTKKYKRYYNITYLYDTLSFTDKDIRCVKGEITPISKEYVRKVITKTIKTKNKNIIDESIQMTINKLKKIDLL